MDKWQNPLPILVLVDLVLLAVLGLVMRKVLNASPPRPRI